MLKRFSDKIATRRIVSSAEKANPLLLDTPEKKYGNAIFLFL